MYHKKILLSIRIDQETLEMIAFLKQRKIRYTDIIRPVMVEKLRSKCKELDFKESSKYVPF